MFHYHTRRHSGSDKGRYYNTSCIYHIDHAYITVACGMVVLTKADVVRSSSPFDQVRMSHTRGWYGTWQFRIYIHGLRNYLTGIKEKGSVWELPVKHGPCTTCCLSNRFPVQLVPESQMPVYGSGSNGMYTVALPLFRILFQPVGIAGAQTMARENTLTAMSQKIIYVERV